MTRSSYARVFAFLVASLALVMPSPLWANNLIDNPGFESGRTAWDLFVPPGVEAGEVKFEVVDGAGVDGSRAARLSSARINRFAIASKTGLPVEPGMRFRIKAWYRAEPGFEVKPGSPGFVLRATFVPVPGRGGQPNHLFIGPGGEVSDSVNSQLSVRPLSTAQWTPIEAEIEVPDGVSRMAVNCFAWYFSGSILVDDVTMETADSGARISETADPRSKSVRLATTAPAEPKAAWTPWENFRVLALDNAGFEAGLEGWEAAGDQGMSRPDSAAAFSGRRGLRITDASEASGSSLQSAYVEARAGNRYHLHWTSRVVMGGGLAVGLCFYDAQRGRLAPREGGDPVMVLPPAGTTAKARSLEADAPPGTAYIRIWIHSLPEAKVIADLDEFTLLEASS